MPATETRSTPTAAPPAGEGWRRDGQAYDCTSGQPEYWWTRVVPETVTERMYVFQADWHPEGRGWSRRETLLPSGRIKYDWTRTVKSEKKNDPT